MDRVQSGDRQAFVFLVDRHKHRLINYLTAMTRDRDQAEDIAQEAFVRLFTHSARYEERGQFVAYLYRIATNLLRAQERTRKRRELLLARFARSSRDNPSSPQDTLLHDEMEQRVADAIARLPLRYRAPLLLHEIEGWPYRDIAEALECREGTVKSRVHRGRDKLRELLTPYWNGGLE